MTRDEAFVLIKKLIIEFDSSVPLPISLSDRFVDDLGFDSLDIVQLCVDLEEEIDKEINEGGLHFKTVNVSNIVDLVVEATA